MQRMWTKSWIYLNDKNKSHSIFLFYCMLELARKAHFVSLQKDPEKE